MDEAARWEQVYAQSEDDDVSWTQREPRVSLELLERAGATPDTRIVDVGCGAAGLAVPLVERGWTRVTGVDLSESALRRAQARLGAAAARASWLVADVRALALPAPVDVWHDRAVFHFLVDAADRAAYVASLRRNLAPGGHAILGTFAPDGPERCSGLPVARYDAHEICAELGAGFTIVHDERETHVTPWGALQRFTWVLLRREA